MYTSLWLADKFVNFQLFFYINFREVFREFFLTNFLFTANTLPILRLLTLLLQLFIYLLLSGCVYFYFAGFPAVVCYPLASYFDNLNIWVINFNLLISILCELSKFTYLQPIVSHDKTKFKTLNFIPSSLMC